ncbi:tRNA pseudouridine(55) synthase TruB [Herbiconiux sp. CPCC 203407]|uniref:tRNA pseudouridine synthase B n=1 Tax=Herbiconiux oxytropis TaxID=2970915 RepID=A0AA41XDD2_9MICO|nr:tRNA pseudouridine(55) synthase TruB [Herbiconiux oxytropis]MCS5720578.1 tRNA pseudouridine(55) synthase TruB [Herbiconiux oxytropis]MCS5726151.1 tRNA pseudouridine(55) synthase TruB [Herbiconiux oxytropis]
MKSPSSTASGILLVDKPAGHTSHDVVARTRRLAGTRKVGHAGTLDPMATGLLVLGVNSSTRLLTYVVGLDKEYLATVRLGAATTTDDAEGELLPGATAGSLGDLTPDAVARAFETQHGTIVQVPSSVSAIKVDGKRAYARVRAGEDVVLEGRTVTISEVELLGEARRGETDEGPFLDVDVRVVCSSGTYIRAIARDVGELLGVGGHLTALRRTRIGPFAVADARTLDDLLERGEHGEALELLDAADVAVRLFPRLDVDAAEATALGHGQRIALPEGRVPAAEADGVLLAAVTPAGRLLGLVERRGSTGKSVVNFPPDEYQEAQP